MRWYAYQKRADETKGMASNPMIGATLVSAPLVGGEKGKGEGEVMLPLSFGQRFAEKDERANLHSLPYLFFSPIFSLLAKRRIGG